MARPRTDPKLLAARGSYRKHPERDATKTAKRGKAAKAAKARDFSTIMTRYMRDVLEGRIPVGKWVRLAIERHLRDRRREAEPGYPYHFDARSAAAFLAKAEGYPHIKGTWATRRELIRFEPWQVFILASIFGWVRKSGKLRRFRDVYIEIPRKNSKSTMGALVGLHMLCDDGEHGAEVYSGATTERQALEVFTPAKLMMERSPKIRDAAGIEVWAKALVRPEDNSKFWPVVRDPGDGASPSCAIVDEFHEHQTSDLIDTMQSGMGARAQPILLTITTAGTSLSSPCFDKHTEVMRLLEGVAENDECFGIIFAIDEGDDWTDPAAIRKANPNWNVSVDGEFLLAQQRQAVQNPAYENRFKTKHLNVWCGASVAGISSADWAACADKSLSLEQFAGERAWFSLDLASKLDLCAYVKLFKRENDYFVFAKHYLPEDTIAEARTNAAYVKWVKEGHLVASDGAEVDFDEIRADVKEDAGRFQVQEVVFDPWRATQLAHQLAKDGATVVEMGQTAANMAAAFDELLSAIKSRRLHHDGDPVLAWQAANVVAKSVAKGLVVPSKDKREAKIDGIVALVMAIARAMAPGETAPEKMNQLMFF